MNEQDLIREFNRLYYDRGLWQKVKWLGVPLLKYPTDLFLYAEIIAKTRPGLIVECGTAYGGSAWFLATICDLVGKGNVFTIDPHNYCKDGDTSCRPEHPRITYYRGGSTEDDTLEEVYHLSQKANGEVLVILDSDHNEAHVYNELELYHGFIPVEGYLIVEDTNLNGNPVVPSHGPGPNEALRSWLPLHPEFVVDTECDRLLLSANPGGYLKRVR